VIESSFAEMLEITTLVPFSANCLGYVQFRPLPPWANYFAVVLTLPSFFTLPVVLLPSFAPEARS
jgi:hypothetical protein